MKNTRHYVLPVTSAAMKKHKVKFGKAVSILLDKTSPSEPGTPPKKAGFSYLIQMFSKMAGFI